MGNPIVVIDEKTYVHCLFFVFMRGSSPADPGSDLMVTMLQDDENAPKRAVLRFRHYHPDSGKSPWAEEGDKDCKTVTTVTARPEVTWDMFEEHVRDMLVHCGSKVGIADEDMHHVKVRGGTEEFSLAIKNLPWMHMRRGDKDGNPLPDGQS